MSAPMWSRRSDTGPGDAATGQAVAVTRSSTGRGCSLPTPPERHGLTCHAASPPSTANGRARVRRGGRHNTKAARHQALRVVRHRATRAQTPANPGSRCRPAALLLLPYAQPRLLPTKAKAFRRHTDLVEPWDGQLRRGRRRTTRGAFERAVLRLLRSGGGRSSAGCFWPSTSAVRRAAAGHGPVTPGPCSPGSSRPPSPRPVAVGPPGTRRTPA